MEMGHGSTQIERYLCAILFGVCIFADEAPLEFSCAEDPCKFGAAAAEAAAAAETLYCTHSIWKADKRTDRLKEEGGADERREKELKREEGGKERRHGRNFKFNFAALSPSPLSLDSTLSLLSLSSLFQLSVSARTGSLSKDFIPLLKDADGARRPSHPPLPPRSSAIQS